MYRDAAESEREDNEIPEDNIDEYSRNAWSEPLQIEKYTELGVKYFSRDVGSCGILTVFYTNIG